MSSNFDLKNVLQLINVGRKALNLLPLRAIPKGVLDHPRQGPLARAFQTEVCGPLPSEGDDDGAEAYFEQLTIARRFGKAFEATTIPVSDGYAVRLPIELSNFHQTFERGLIPRLIDSDCVDFQTAKVRLNLLHVETVEDLVNAGLLPLATNDEYGELIRISDLTIHAKAVNSGRRKAA